MLEFYKYKIDHGMMTLSQVPDPYRTQLIKLGYTEAGPPAPETPEQGE